MYEHYCIGPPPKFWLKINQDKPFHTCMMIMMLNRKSERPSAPFFREKGEKRVNIQMRIVIGIGFPSWFFVPKNFHVLLLLFRMYSCCYCMPNRLAFSIQTQRRAKRTVNTTPFTTIWKCPFKADLQSRIWMAWQFHLHLSFPAIFCCCWEVFVRICIQN